MIVSVFSHNQPKHSSNCLRRCSPFTLHGYCTTQLLVCFFFFFYHNVSRVVMAHMQWLLYLALFFPSSGHLPNTNLHPYCWTKVWFSAQQLFNSREHIKAVVTVAGVTSRLWFFRSWHSGQLVDITFKYWLVSLGASANALQKYVYYTCCCP